MLNIPSSIDDPSYRYKMPRILSKQESRGNGKKTSIINLGDISRALKTDPVYLTKFFGYELCSEASYSNRECEGERVVVKGHHDPVAFQTVVDKFIEKYVLCPGCNLPETDMVVKKGLVVAACKACGWTGELDNGHRLANYIVRNPPSTDIGFDGKKKKTKEERQKERAAKAIKKKDEEDEETASYQSEWDEPKSSKEGREKEKKAKKEKKDKKEHNESRDHDAEHRGEVKEKKSKKEKKEKKEGKETDKRGAKDKKEKDDKSANESEEEELHHDGMAIAAVIQHLSDHVKSNPQTTKEDFFAEVRAQQVTKAFDHKLRVYVVVSALFPDGVLNADGVRHHSKCLREFTCKAKMSFADWIWGFEAYLAMNPTATKAWPLAVKALYDEELAEEEDILEYYKKTHDNPGFEASKKAIGPFLQWLETTGESDDDSSEDSE